MMKMRGEDLDAIRELARRNPWLRPARAIGPSSEAEEVCLAYEEWGVSLEPVPQSAWDLREPPPAHFVGADLMLACNTFMCSTDPALWLHNAAMAADYLLMQDLAVARRAPGRHCAVNTGDVMRYSVSERHVIGETDPGLSVFDLSTCGAKVLDCVPYFHYEDGRPGKFAVLLDLRPLRG